MPLEAVIVFEATTTIPDIFKTLLNVTGDMSAAAMLSRSTRGETAEAELIDDRNIVPEGAS